MGGEGVEWAVERQVNTALTTVSVMCGTFDYRSLRLCCADFLVKKKILNLISSAVVE